MMAALARNQSVRQPRILNSRPKTCLIFTKSETNMAATGPDLIVNMAARALSVEYLWILLNSNIVSEFYIVVDKAPRGENISTVEKYIL